MEEGTSLWGHQCSLDVYSTSNWNAVEFTLEYLLAAEVSLGEKS